MARALVPLGKEMFEATVRPFVGKPGVEPEEVLAQVDGQQPQSLSPQDAIDSCRPRHGVFSRLLGFEDVQLPFGNEQPQQQLQQQQQQQQQAQPVMQGNVLTMKKQRDVGQPPRSNDDDDDEPIASERVGEQEPHMGLVASRDGGNIHYQTIKQTDPPRQVEPPTIRTTLQYRDPWKTTAHGAAHPL